MRQAPDIDLRLATDALGWPISEGARGRLLAYMAAPGREGWEAIHSIMLGPETSVWSAVLAMDPSFPRTGPRRDCRGRIRGPGWRRFPTPAQLAQAIGYATR